MVAPLLRGRRARPRATYRRARPRRSRRWCARPRSRRPTRRSSGSRIHDALAAIWTIVDELNGYITEQEPWALAKDDAQRERLGTVLVHGGGGPARPGRAAVAGDADGARRSCGRRSAPSRQLGALDDQPHPRGGRLGPAARRHRRSTARAAVPADRAEAECLTVLHRIPASDPAAGVGPTRRDLSYPPLPEALVRRASTTTTRTSRSQDGEAGRSTTASSSTAPPAVGMRGVVQVGATSRRPLVGRGWRRSTRGCSPPSRCTRTTPRTTRERGELDEALAVIDRARRAAARAGRRRDRPRLLPHRRGRGGPAQFAIVRGAHRDREAARPRPADPRPRRARGGRRHAASGSAPPTARSSTASPATRSWRGICADNGWYMSFAGNVTFKNARALREALGRRPAQPDPRGDGCAVPDAGAVPRPAERAVPHPAHAPRDGGHARHRRVDARRADRLEHRGGLRRWDAEPPTLSVPPRSA